MAEFQEVIGQFKRLCDSANQDCSGCGLRNMSCSVKDIVDNSVEFEKRVMAWAAEHAKPQYPTVYEWLVSVGLLSGDMWSVSDLHKPISPEFAQMLGIQPVPVVHGDCGATSEKEARKKLGLQSKEG